MASMLDRVKQRIQGWFRIKDRHSDKEKRVTMKNLRTKLMLFGFCLAVGIGLVAGPGCGGGFPIPDLPEKVVGYCIYKNNFSGSNECKEYVGSWTVKEATDDCKGNGSTIQLDKRCGNAQDKKLGDCIFIINKEKEKYARVEIPGDNKERCGGTQRGCEFFGGGSFVPSQVCGGVVDTGDTPSTLPVFRPGQLDCKDPLPGDAKGKGPNGQVCTMSAISGASEPGRDFTKYGNCELVRTQRPYYPVPPNDGHDKDDPRMKDPAYLKENDWVKAQVQATACVCCHTTTAPQGPSNWYVESSPNWINSMSDKALAMGAGWISGVGFGAYPSEKNNGFTRPTPADPNHTIFTTNDDARMRKFFENELKHRGRKKDDFKDEKYAAGPLDTQRFYKPKECADTQTIDADGSIRWIGGSARYIHVLEADASSPGVPPNLDKPEGTIWKVDVDADIGTPIKSGEIKFGEVPAGAKQDFPAKGKPKALESGKTYYLFVLKDIVNPLTRCLFKAK